MIQSLYRKYEGLKIRHKGFPWIRGAVVTLQDEKTALMFVGSVGPTAAILTNAIGSNEGYESVVLGTECLVAPSPHAVVASIGYSSTGAT